MRKIIICMYRNMIANLIVVIPYSNVIMATLESQGYVEGDEMLYSLKSGECCIVYLFWLCSLAPSRLGRTISVYFNPS